MPSPVVTVAEIRQKFLDFFKEKGHTVVASSPLVPGNDPTLMFTNSGMVQFKDVFLGMDQRAYVRAASVQACLRAGGKHNDLENVGYTARHHTFFEMLGNWSFGDYFKRESLLWGWELLTKIYGIPAERLTATVYMDDDEAYDIWTKEIGLSPECVVRIGDNKGKKYASDNFWMMADTGPCGPCSEIFYDHGTHVSGGPPGSSDEDGDRFIEIWNHVFMQFEMHADGSLTKLPAPCVDTGMGLERLAAVLQHVNSNYEIDLFTTLIRAAARATRCKNLRNPSLKVIADHIRAASFLITDGVLPSNEGRGYVARRIVRRAIRHGYKLGQKTPFFYRLVADLVAQMGAAYPRLAQANERIAQALQTEEERFFETLETGMETLEAELAKGNGQIAGAVAFKLHDTYGFPLDLTRDIARERKVVVDSSGFEKAMQKQKDRARAAGKFKMDKILDYQGPSTIFVGYTQWAQHGQIVGLYEEEGGAVSRLEQGQKGIVVLDATPFYAESGGQVGDRGVLSAEHALFEVEDTQKIKSNVFGHHGFVRNGCLRLGECVHAQIDAVRRVATVRHHSATHLMHKALREVLGSHVQQKGSEVSAERTRFDFSHNGPLSSEQISEIEGLVNAEILQNLATRERMMAIEDAKISGAVMLFGEKYGDTVRVLDIGSSTELCGGTHVDSTGDIGLFKVLSESGVAAGVRRIEAVVGLAALDYLQNLERSVQQAADIVKANPATLGERLVQLQAQSKAQEKEIQVLKGAMAQMRSDSLLVQVQAVGKLQLLATHVPGLDARVLREMASGLKDKLPQGVVVLASGGKGKVQIVAALAPAVLATLKAGEVINHVAAQVGGKGGGKADFAMAGGSDWEQVPAALASLKPWLEARV